MKRLFLIIGLILAATFLSLYFNKAGGNEAGEKIKTGNSFTGTVYADNPFAGQYDNYNSSFSPRSGGWQLQVMPNMGGRLVRDIYFTDSLTGYAVASPDSPIDSAHILKTTNGGNNWLINYTKAGRLKRIIFINTNTGYAGGSYLLKTTNGGNNWMVWNWPLNRVIYDMQVFGEDTIWYGDSDPIAGGTYRTTNGGINWVKRDNGIPSNSYPFYIYFFNSRIGFATGNTNVYKTTDAGLNWSIAFTGGAQKLFFTDSLNGYRAMQGFYRTTNGGFNWSKDSLPDIIGNTYTNKWVSTFVKIDNGVIYCSGGYVYYNGNGRYKATVYKTTNEGLNWGYQIPDTSYGLISLNILYAINSNVWSYDNYYNKGIYSSAGGDTTIYVGISSGQNRNPENFELNQNYPNPFNQLTVIRYQLSRRRWSSTSNVNIKIFDLTGKEIAVLNEGNKQPGNYEIRFDAGNLGSGVYFYQLIVDNEIVKTRKMILLK